MDGREHQQYQKDTASDGEIELLDIADLYEDILSLDDLEDDLGVDIAEIPIVVTPEEEIAVVFKSLILTFGEAFVVAYFFHILGIKSFLSENLSEELVMLLNLPVGLVFFTLLQINMFSFAEKSGISFFEQDSGDIDINLSPDELISKDLSKQIEIVDLKKSIILKSMLIISSGIFVISGTTYLLSVLEIVSYRNPEVLCNLYFALLILSIPIGVLQAEIMARRNKISFIGKPIEKMKKRKNID